MGQQSEETLFLSLDLERFDDLLSTKDWKILPILNDEEIDIPILEIREEVPNEQIGRLKSVRKKRNNKVVSSKLRAITNACQTKENLIPLIIDAAQAYATLGEIVDSMKVVFGEWQESAVL